MAARRLFLGRGAPDTSTASSAPKAVSSARLELLLARMPAGNGTTAESVAARVIDEVFIDMHAGFYNGRVKRAC